MSEIISSVNNIMKPVTLATNNNNASNNFTPTQQSAFNDYLQGKNVFITGSEMWKIVFHTESISTCKTMIKTSE